MTFYKHNPNHPCMSKPSQDLLYTFLFWQDINTGDETDSGAQCATVSDLFPVGTECFMMAIPHYGSAGKVCSSWHEISGIFGNGRFWQCISILAINATYALLWKNEGKLSSFFRVPVAERCLKISLLFSSSKHSFNLITDECSRSKSVLLTAKAEKCSRENYLCATIQICWSQSSRRPTILLYYCVATILNRLLK